MSGERTFGTVSNAGRGTETTENMRLFLGKLETNVYSGERVERRL